MGYVAAGTFGILLASIVNLYIGFEERKEPLLTWYLIAAFSSLKSLVIMAAMVLACLFIYKEYGITLDFIKYTVLITLLIAAGIVDLKSGIIPNSIVLAGLFTGIVFSIINGPRDAAFKLFAGVITALLLLLVSWLSKGGIGMGDVKLIAVLGVFLGLGMTLSVLAVSVILGGIAAAVMLLTRKAERKGTLPFAPFLFLGTTIIILLGK